MRIAVMIISLFLSVLIGLQSCTVAVSGKLAQNGGLYQGGLSGIVMALLFIVGGAFVMRMPRAAAFAFAFATGIGLHDAQGNVFKDLTIWGFVAGALGFMSLFGYRELKKDEEKAEGKPQSTTRNEPRW